MYTTLAVPYEDGNIAESFEKAKEFKIYIVEEDNTISHTEVLPFKGKGAASHAVDLGMQVTNMLICNRIKESSRLSTAEANIRLSVGNSGEADEVVKSFVEEGRHINTGMWGKATRMAGGGVLRAKQKEYEAIKKQKKQAREAEGGVLGKLLGKKDK